MPSKILASITRGASLVVLVLIVGCDEAAEQSLAPQTNARVLPSYVTAELASLITADGKIALAAPSLEPGEIDEARALALASAYVQTFASFHKTYLERGVGSPVDPLSLKPCDRAFFAATPYGPVQAVDAPTYVAKLYASHWLVALCAPNGSVQGNLVVAARNFDVGIEGGQIRFTMSHGNDFRLEAAPGGRQVPMSPERAIQLVHAATGAHVASVPELIAPHEHFSAVWARWRMRTDIPVTVERVTSGARQQLTELYVGYGGVKEPEVLEIPASTQPSSVSIEYNSLDFSVPGAQGAVHATTLAVRPDRPLVFERVRVVTMAVTP
jgi:hypothetical protein